MFTYIIYEEKTTAVAFIKKMQFYKNTMQRFFFKNKNIEIRYY